MMNMQVPSLILLVLALIPFYSSSSSITILNQGSSLSQRDVLLSSPNPIFTAGFYPVGENAYCFAIWFTNLSTIVWMANRDQPVNGRATTLSLSDTGTLVLVDAGHVIVWTSGTESSSPTQLQLHDNGNLVLRNSINDNRIIWQSFDSPTNTLLPQQPLTRTTQLISSRSLTNHSSGFYKLYFDKDNVLRLFYEGVEITSAFWPPPWLNSWQAGRTTFNDTKFAVLDSFGKFVSSDYFQFETSDFAKGPQRRLILEPDGLLRVYSLNNDNNSWQVTWQVSLQPCRTHGICGANGLCTYTPELGPRCACLPGYKIKNKIDWSEGCVPDFELRCNDDTEDDSSTFVVLNHVEYYGYDIGYYQNYTVDQCKNLCLSYCSCKGFQYKFEPANGVYSCFPKTLLFNGYQSIGFEYWLYLRLPKNGLTPDKRSIQQIDLQCTSTVMEMERNYRKENQHSWLKPLAWCAGVIGVIEIICLLIFFYKTRKTSITNHYLLVETGFKRFTYAEMKKVSRSFSEEIGRGGSGVVYKGTLADNRVAAIKCLINFPKENEAEFLAEVGMIGRLNHANLIDQWGYCVEGKHRILVYEYLENGSLAENLKSEKLDWKQRFEIALGMARGLAYLHEECLEWVLHCDVKPQNILLGLDFEAKVADFGLSKQVKRSGVEKNGMNVSKVRGTRGYMAPEWVLNLPITSKVDVYSYGIVVMEMITGKSPQELVSFDGGVEKKMDLVRQKMGIEGVDDGGKMENLMRVALQCAQENKEARPTMRQVIHMLLQQET